MPTGMEDARFEQAVARHLEPPFVLKEKIKEGGTCCYYPDCKCKAKLGCLCLSMCDRFTGGQYRRCEARRSISWVGRRRRRINGAGTRIGAPGPRPHMLRIDCGLGSIPISTLGIDSLMCWHFKKRCRALFHTLGHAQCFLVRIHVISLHTWFIMLCCIMLFALTW